MKFPRNSKILRSQFDVAPFAAVFFIIVIFVMLGALMPVAGVRVRLQPPAASDLPGVDRRSVAMAVDSAGQFYYENKLVSEQQLKTRLRDKATAAHEPLTLIIHADKSVSYDQLTHIIMLARDLDPKAGITNILLATLPR